MTIQYMYDSGTRHGNTFSVHMHVHLTESVVGWHGYALAAIQTESLQPPKRCVCKCAILEKFCTQQHSYSSWRMSLKFATEISNYYFLHVPLNYKRPTAKYKGLQTVIFSWNGIIFE